jgi:hypothetical protein
MSTIIELLTYLLYRVLHKYGNISNNSHRIKIFTQFLLKTESP